MIDLRTDFVARYRGQVLGYFDTPELAEAAIDAARAEQQDEDADFYAWRMA